MKDNNILIKRIIGYATIVLVVVVGVLTKSIYYIQCDDYQMNLIANGTFSGKYDEHLVFIKSFYGFIIKILNELSSAINWFGLLLLVFIILCSSVVFYIFSNYIRWYYSLILAIVVEIISLEWIHFSFISYLCVGTSIILIAELLTNTIKNKYLLIVIAYILFNISLLLRTDAFVTGFCLGVPTLFYLFIKHKNKVHMKKLIKYLVIELMLLIAIFGVEKYSYNSQTWSDYNQYNSVRSKVMDYKIADYESLTKKKDIRWSKNDYDCLKAWIFADKQVYSLNNFNKVLDITNISTRYDFNIFNIIIKMIKLKETIFFAIILVFLIILSKQNRRIIIIQGLLSFGLVGLLFLMQRVFQRVFIGIILIGIIYILYLWIKDKERKQNYKICEKISALVIMVGVVFLVVSYARYSLNTSKMLNGREKLYQQERQYILDNKDKVFVSYKFFEILHYQPITSVKAEGKFDNYFCLGSWDMYTERYYDQVKKYKFRNKDSVLMNLVYDDDCYFIAQKNYTDFPVIKLLKKYLSEHSHAIIKTKKIRTFKESGDTLYKFSIKK